MTVNTTSTQPRVCKCNMQVSRPRRRSRRQTTSFSLILTSFFFFFLIFSRKLRGRVTRNIEKKAHGLTSQNPSHLCKSVWGTGAAMPSSAAKEDFPLCSAQLVWATRNSKLSPAVRLPMVRERRHRVDERSHVLYMYFSCGHSFHSVCVPGTWPGEWTVGRLIKPL